MSAVSAGIPAAMSHGTGSDVRVTLNTWYVDRCVGERRICHKFRRDSSSVTCDLHSCTVSYEHASSAATHIFSCTSLAGARRACSLSTENSRSMARATHPRQAGHNKRTRPIDSALTEQQSHRAHRTLCGEQTSVPALTQRWMC